MTLTEFLIARIADDEKWARARRDEDFRKHRVSARRPHLAPDDAERVLADCAAKRVAVDWYLNDDDTVMSATVKAMAAVYADHPDYRQEWR